MSKEKKSGSAGIVRVRLVNATSDVVILYVPTNDVNVFTKETLLLRDGELRKFIGFIEYVVTDTHVSFLFDEAMDFKVTEFYQVKEKEFYTDQEIDEEYSNLTVSERLRVTNKALEYMQEYNGRSIFTCKAMAMGYTNTEGEKDKWKKN
jgi:hypothetical protein